MAQEERRELKGEIQRLESALGRAQDERKGEAEQRLAEVSAIENSGIMFGLDPSLECRWKSK